MTGLALKLAAGALGTNILGSLAGSSDDPTLKAIGSAVGGVFDVLTGESGEKRSESMYNSRLASEANARQQEIMMAMEDRRQAREDAAEERRIEREMRLEERKQAREDAERREAAAREERAFLMATANAKEAKDAAIAAAAQQRQDQLKRDELNAQIVRESRAAALERFRATKVDFPKLRPIPELDEEKAKPRREALGGALMAAGAYAAKKYIEHRMKGDDEKEEEAPPEVKEKIKKAKKKVEEAAETVAILHPMGGFHNIPVAEQITRDPGFTMKMPRHRESIN